MVLDALKAAAEKKSPNGLQSDEQLLSYYKAFEVKGTPLEQEVKIMTKKMGISEPVKVYVSRSKAINAALTVNNKGEHRIILTEPLIKVSESTPYSKVSEELKFTLGHELGHLAEGTFKPYLYGGALPMISLPFIAVAARHYLHRAHAKQVPTHQAKQYIDHEADLEYNPLEHYSMDPVPQKYDNAILAIAKDIAAAAVGLSAGSLIAKVNADLIELRCDRWGAKMSSPQAGVRSFQQEEEAFAQRILKGIKVPQEDPFKYGKAVSQTEKFFKDFIQSTIFSHPDTKVRIAVLERMIPDVARAL